MADKNVINRTIVLKRIKTKMGVVLLKTHRSFVAEVVSM